MKTKILITLIVSLLFSLHSAFAQGNLTPSAPPGPTMVTLSQMEPRTPISSLPYTISQGGSYYLTTNLVSHGDAITINANGVTLDLGGFTISSATNPAMGTAILLNGAVTNVAIFNGHIISGITNSSSGSYAGSGFANGIYDPGTPVNVRVKDVSVTGVLDYGIVLGTASTLVEACVVNVAGMDGIQANTVFDSTALNAGSDGVISETAENCYGSTVVNYGDAIFGYMLENCYGSTSGNGFGINASTAENCWGYSAGGPGIFTDTAENCYGYTVTGYGIEAQAAVNCQGISDGSGTGIFAIVEAQNCSGQSSTGIGLVAASATSCSGSSNGSGYGLDVTYQALGCYGYSASGTGLIAFLANSCVGNTTSGTATNLTHDINSFAY
jgi:hypothetical protein